MQRGNPTHRLYECIYNQDADGVLDSLKAKVDPNGVGEDGVYCLVAAIKNFDTENPNTMFILKELLNAGADPLLPLKGTPETIFEFALMEECSYLCFEMLFSKIKQDGHLSKVKLTYAATHNNSHILFALITHGVTQDAHKAITDRLESYLNNEIFFSHSVDYHCILALWEIVKKTGGAALSFNSCYTFVRLAIDNKDYATALHFITTRQTHFQSKLHAEWERLPQSPHLILALLSNKTVTPETITTEHAALIIYMLRESRLKFYTAIRLLQLDVRKASHIREQYRPTPTLVMLAKHMDTVFHSAVITFINPFQQTLSDNVGLTVQVRLLMAVYFIRASLGKLTNAISNEALTDILVERIRSYHYARAEALTQFMMQQLPHKNLPEKLRTDWQEAIKNGITFLSQGTQRQTFVALLQSCDLKIISTPALIQRAVVFNMQLIHQHYNIPITYEQFDSTVSFNKNHRVARTLLTQLRFHDENPESIAKLNPLLDYIQTVIKDDKPVLACIHDFLAKYSFGLDLSPTDNHYLAKIAPKLTRPAPLTPPVSPITDKTPLAKAKELIGRSALRNVCYKNTLRYMDRVAKLGNISLSKLIRLDNRHLENSLLWHPLTHQIIRGKLSPRERVLYRTLLSASWKLTHRVQEEKDLQKILEDNEIRSVLLRKRRNIKVVNQRTPVSELEGYVFATMGPLKSPVPHSLKQASAIEIDVAALLEKKPSFFNHVSTTYHWSAFSQSQIYDAVSYSVTKVLTYHNKLEKISEYRESDTPKRTSNRFHDGVYGGKRILHVLSLLFIDQLRRIGGDFYSHLMEQADNIELIADAYFHIMHPGVIEVRYPVAIPLDAAYYRLLPPTAALQITIEQAEEALTNLSTLQTLFAKGFNPNQRFIIPHDKHQYAGNLLTLAILRRQTAVIDLILAGHTIHYVDGHASTLGPLEAAFLINDEVTVRKLLAHGTPMSALLRIRNHPIITAALIRQYVFKMSLDSVPLILSMATTVVLTSLIPDVIYHADFTEEKRMAWVELLLRFGASPDLAVDPQLSEKEAAVMYMQAPIVHAISTGNLALATCLIKADAILSFTIMTGEFQEIDLYHYALFHHQHEILKLMMTDQETEFDEGFYCQLPFLLTLFLSGEEQLLRCAMKQWEHEGKESSETISFEELTYRLVTHLLAFQQETLAAMLEKNCQFDSRIRHGFKQNYINLFLKSLVTHRDSKELLKYCLMSELLKSVDYILMNHPFSTDLLFSLLNDALKNTSDLYERILLNNVVYAVIIRHVSLHNRFDEFVNLLHQIPTLLLPLLIQTSTVVSLQQLHIPSFIDMLLAPMPNHRLYQDTIRYLQQPGHLTQLLHYIATDPMPESKRNALLSVLPQFNHTPSLMPAPEEGKRAVVALMTCMDVNRQQYIYLGRKKNRPNSPLMAPGGYVSNKDNNPFESLLREIKEETNYDWRRVLYAPNEDKHFYDHLRKLGSVTNIYNDSDTTLLFEYMPPSSANNSRHIQFYSLTTNWDLRERFKAADDFCDGQWVPLNEIQYDATTQRFRYQNQEILRSNGLLIMLLKGHLLNRPNLQDVITQELAARPQHTITLFAPKRKAEDGTANDAKQARHHDAPLNHQGISL